MGVAATAAAKKNKLKITREWKANARKDSDAFKASEQMSRDKYNEFTKLSRAFVAAYPDEFKTFLVARSRGIPVARQSFGLPRHMPTTVPATMLAPMTPIQLTDFKSFPSERRVPSAQSLEARRIQPSGGSNPLADLGIRLD
jgi:hypothetical protein